MTIFGIDPLALIVLLLGAVIALSHTVLSQRETMREYRHVGKEKDKHITLLIESMAAMRLISDKLKFVIERQDLLMDTEGRRLEAVTTQIKESVSS